MFIERKDKSLKNVGWDKANKLLLDNIQEHLMLLHDQEISLTKDDSERFTKQVITRHKNVYPCNCPLTEDRGELQKEC